MHIPRYKTTEQATVNILLAGVGGQGVLVASDILVDVAMHAGLDTKKSEVHGMAQRGGSVISQVRYGAKIHSPLIPDGEADILLAFEKLETLRYIDTMRSDAVIIFNTQQITPLTVFSTNIEYPGNIKDICQRKTDYVYSVDGTTKAEKLGNPKVVNSVMLGVLSQFLEFEPDVWKHIIGKRVPQKTIKLNHDAFNIGRQYIAAKRKEQSDCISR